MNYPCNVAGGQTAFFAEFAFFSDEELLFMRHAPARFVQRGDADWFDDHGFQQAEISPEPSFLLELRVNRQKAIFEFLEPINARHGSARECSDRQPLGPVVSSRSRPS